MVIAIISVRSQPPTDPDTELPHSPLQDHPWFEEHYPEAIVLHPTIQPQLRSGVPNDPVR